MALQWTAGFEFWVSSLAQGPLSSYYHRPRELFIAECVCTCVCFAWCQKTPSIPKCNSARLHTPRAPCRMSILKLLSFSMNAQVCNLAPTNWIKISGGFIPSGSAWSPAFHCNNCQSWGRTELNLDGGICSYF